ncbi:hypothetical protein PPSIR1_25916 [Plesiocystis pacifica SIR-1]|uniref:DUF2330 domain-containing protein n=1 Tax=Plesiocystis pacifica SIR-1 TaxID=391625 RepID=A6FZJ7_9BACT|nr:DUF2330 domain-containing protein [Plesiocystis pacifica]EDM81081.1 hypothetical protein PPSIR1_25916 [Plesiocystis pacifica SIR-1]
MNFRLSCSLAGAALAFAIPALLPSSAQACGGTMCDTGPTAMPVDQTGENILFHLTDTSVEAHIQIQYDPDTEAEKFAWVIPVTAIPEFEVGSDLLFRAMLAGSVPRYANQVTQDFCGDGGDEFGGDEGGATGAGDDGGGEGEGPGNGGPDVVLEQSVGAYEIAVLDGGTVEGVMQWLGDNGYQQDPAAEPLLAQYLEDEFLFVALKLNTSAGVDEIHPIVIRYEGYEPCVPIRLTAIAAAENMDIRTFFLGDARVVPVNYRHVLVNPLKIDWFNLADNYKEVITMAVDAPGADGNAFVTEYAGPSNVVNTGGVYSPDWDPAAYLALTDTPVGVIDILEQQNLIFCDTEWDNVCTAFHPLLQPILDQFVPVPEGIDPVAFYDCMECYAEDVDLAAWDAAGFSEMFDERIVKPGFNAATLVDENPYLTRMYTTISPAEMVADPIFRANATLPEVQNLRTSTQTLHCDGSTTMTLPDGREILFPAGAALEWPDFQTEMPWVEDVDQESMAENAPLISIADNTEQIDELLASWNSEQEEENAAANEGGDAGTNAGCACSVDEGKGAGGIGLGLALLGLAGFVRRRRR